MIESWGYGPDLSAGVKEVSGLLQEQGNPAAALRCLFDGDKVVDRLATVWDSRAVESTTHGSASRREAFVAGGLGALSVLRGANFEGTLEEIQRMSEDTMRRSLLRRPSLPPVPREDLQPRARRGLNRHPETRPVVRPVAAVLKEEGEPLDPSAMIGFGFVLDELDRGWTDACDKVWPKLPKRLT